MAEPTSLSERWQDTDRANQEPGGYYSPCVICRAKDPAATSADKGVQMLVEPEGDGRYTVKHLTFFLTHNGNYSDGTPEQATIIARGQTPGAAIQTAFSFLGKVLESVKLEKDYAPQVWKGRNPADCKGAQPLAKMLAFVTPEDKDEAARILQRLSSQWGKKTTHFHQIPRPRLAREDFDWR